SGICEKADFAGQSSNGRNDAETGNDRQIILHRLYILEAVSKKDSLFYFLFIYIAVT
ncbi:MAG: hypothetical protein PWQ71_971, partial [Bacteroidota bacterium]|nr:hypothetical protein [Bacteroidota bacterium]